MAKIEKVISYKTSDGIVFVSEKDAALHQAKINTEHDLRNFVRDQEHIINRIDANIIKLAERLIDGMVSPK